MPGPEAQQVATYIGWRLHGTVGGIVAGSFFVIPSIFVLWLLSYLAVAHSDVPAITGLLYGIQPVVIAIVVEAVLRIGKRTINHRVLVGFAIVAFVALYFLSVPFPLVVLAAAVAGLLLSRTRFAGEAFAGGGARLLGGRGVCHRPDGFERQALLAAQPEAPWDLRPAVGAPVGGALPVEGRGGRARQGGAVLHGGGLPDLRGGLLGP